MRDIPTIQEPEKLRELYRAKYGDTSDNYRKDRLDWLEFELLNDVYREKFHTNVGTMCYCGPISDLSARIRESLRTGKPYKPNIPEGAVI